MKLSDVKYSDLLMRKVTKEDIDKIVYSGDVVDLENPKSDIGIVLGGPGMIPYRVNKGIELYKEGMINKLIVCGGIGYLNKDRVTPEAFKMRDYLLEQGIPGEDVIAESFSRNTVENFQNVLAILDGIYDLDKTRFTVVTSDFHLRRSVGLYIRELGISKSVQGRGSRDGVTDIFSWDKTNMGRRQILQEALLLINYAKSDKIVDVEIDGLSLKRCK